MLQSYFSLFLGIPAGIKTAYSFPTKTKRLSYRGLEKGVTLDDGGKKIPLMKHTEVQMQAVIVSEIMLFKRKVDSGCGQIVKIV